MGVSLGCITADTPRTDRRKIYSKQVVYLTAKEAGFDYLRDFVCFEPSEMVFPQKLNFAIVDEADSIMIDEARIPLVIAGDIAAEDDGSTAEVYEKTADFTDDDYGIDDDSRNVYLTDAGADKAESVFSCDIYAAENTGLLAKICACLKARVMLQEDKDYILRDGAVILVDEFTGRAAPGRVFPGDLQAAVEAKHGLKLTSRGRIMGNIALQYFLRLFPKLAGMTGTAIQSKEEFDTIYGLPTEVIPTRLPCRRTDHPLEMYFDKTEKRKAVIEAIREAHGISRPVLVGTESIGESEELADELRKLGIECAVLNAKNDEAEADIISRAGAMTITELMAIGRPAVLVPYPNAAENHQYYNALTLSNAHAAILIEDKDLTKARLVEEVSELYNDRGRLALMEENSRRSAKNDAADRILGEIIDLLGKEKFENQGSTD